MERKYKLLKETARRFKGVTLYRIQALKDFGNVKEGELGGWVSGYTCLKQDGNCWIYDESIVFDNSAISENALIKGSSVIFNSTRISGNTEIVGNVKISNSLIMGDTIICNKAKHGMIDILDAEISKNVSIVTTGEDQAQIYIFNAKLADGVNIFVNGFAKISGEKERVTLDGSLHLRDDICITSNRDVYFIKMNGENKHVTFYKTNGNSVSVYIGAVGLYDLNSLENFYENMVPDMNSADTQTLDVLLDTVCKHMGIEMYKGKDVKNISFKVVEEQIENLEPNPIDTEDAENLMKYMRNSFYTRTAMK